MNNDDKSKLNNLYVRFKWLFFVYALFWLFWFSVVIWAGTYKSLFETRFGMYDGFVESWSSSLFQDLFFFGIGFLGIVFSTKLLTEETFDVKVNALANAKSISSVVLNEFINEMEKILSYNKTHNVEINIKEISTQKTHVFVYIKMTTVMANMCGNNKIPIYMKTFVERGDLVDGKYGEINKFTVVHTPDKKTPHVEPKIFVDDEPLDLRLVPPVYRKTFTYPVYENGEAVCKLFFSLWVPLGRDKSNKENWLFSKLHMFTERSTFTINNRLDIPFTLRVKYPKRNPGKRNEPNTEHSINIQTEYDEKDHLIESNDKGIIIAQNISLDREDSFDIYFSL